MMIDSVELKNFGPIDRLKWEDLGRINLVIGENDTGKTFILKAIYSAIKTIEEYRRGDDPRSTSDILQEKLFWTFQAERIGDLVQKGSSGSMQFKLKYNGKYFSYSFGKETSSDIKSVENNTDTRESNSIFMPAKEILSLDNMILKTREQEKIFGFDDTYYDLAKALRISPQMGKNFEAFSHSRKKLEAIFGGKIEFEEASSKWRFKKGNQKFAIGVTSEGVKKIAILDRLLTNRYLDANSVIFMDEPESALHPAAVAQLLEIVGLLAKRGVQFFLASHSYFVVKNLFLIAQKNEIATRILSNKNGEWVSSDLSQGLPENPIVDESIRLYKKEVGLVLK